MTKAFHQLLAAAVLFPLSSIAYAEIAGVSPAEIAKDSALARSNSVQLGYSLDSYSQYFSDNPIATLKYGRITSWGSLSIQANSSNRRQTSDTQYEINVYPKLWKSSWAELNLGTSAGNLFALNSQGAEVFSSLENGYEASIGLRHLAFLNSAVTLYTGSLSKYAGNYLFTVRPYVTPSSIGTSISGNIKITRYFSDADHFLRLNASAGKSAEERTFANIPPQAVTLRSRSLGITGQWSPRIGVFISPSFGHERQEVLFSPGEFVGIDKFSATISYRFK
ncbi:MAG: YaiO family outer membrane beta-barrel protein [Gallionella sp.]|nr:YaiO family outer membrane beta-barrel protein [Gallionella sp.]